MSFEVTINIPGLKELSEALSQMASVMGGRSMLPENKAVMQAPAQEISCNAAEQAMHAQPPVQPDPIQSTVVQSPTPTIPAQTAVPTSAPSYTRDDLSRAAMQLMDKGLQMQLMGLIQSFGVASLMELPPDQYGAFATGLRGLGAQI